MPNRLLPPKARPALVTLGLLATLVPPPARADDPVTRLYTASELPRLAQGVALPREGSYTLKVWAPERQRWSLAVEGATVTLTPKDEGNTTAPTWQTVGTVPVAAKTPLKLVVARPKEAPATDKDQPKTKDKEKKGAPPVPAIVALSTDPSYDPGLALEVVRGRLDSVEPPADPRRTKVRTNWEGADFKAPVSAEAWRERARAVRTHLNITTGLWPEFPRTPLNPKVYGKLERDGYTIEKVVLETFPGFTLSGNLYRPTGKTGKLPGMLCPHGHWPVGRVEPEVQQRCIRWAKLGCVVFLYDMVGRADGEPFGHAFLNDRLNRWGLSLVTLHTWDSLRALDWLTSLPDVDPARIGCTGESGGGTQTFLLTALDDRIKVAAPVVMVSDTFQGGCTCENAAGLRHGTDNVEFAALTAPRPLKLVGATGDWTAKTMTNAYPAIRGVYALLGTTDRVSADVFDFPHNYNQTTRNAVYGFMAKWLLGIDDASSTKERPQMPERAQDIYTFDTEHPAPWGYNRPDQLEAYLVRTRQQQIASLAPSANAEAAAPWQAARSLLLTILRERVGLVNPGPSELTSVEVRRASREGLTIVHTNVGRKATGERIPVVRLIPAHPSGRLTVIASPHGKAHLVAEDGRPIPLVRNLLERGQSVVGFDPLFVGESQDPAAPADHRPDTVHYEAYNPALPCDQLQDLATVLAWSRSQPDVREVSLVGEGRSGPQVLLARPVLDGVARTVVNLHESADGDGSAAPTDTTEFPGLLQFGGLKVAAALSAPAPLWIYRTGPAFDRAWPEKAYSRDDAGFALRLDADRPDPAVIARWIDTGER
ncbi:MAG: acetylxylan esterase [Isosphaeraceae bacterium]|nr:acetylxylan esterase [Isosphaeraceae bacterium]